MGASGFGYEIARQFGHEVLPMRAGLVPFTFRDGSKAVSERPSGLAHEAIISNERKGFWRTGRPVYPKNGKYFVFRVKKRK
ncbi:MAG: NAD(P)/FAD-dependent oxidoreductase [Moraxellaceae bacterium]|nr:NAD(P)/FAD-dependent oxidoreductase [Moraxellaceae bacterium]